MSCMLRGAAKFVKGLSKLPGGAQDEPPVEPRINQWTPPRTCVQA